MIDQHLLDQLRAAGLDIYEKQQGMWYMRRANWDRGPYDNASTALVEAVRWLVTMQNISDNVIEDLAEVYMMQLQPPDEPPQPFRSLLG